MDFVGSVGRKYAEAAGRGGRRSGGGRVHVDADIRERESGEPVVESVTVELVFLPDFDVWTVAVHRSVPSKLEARLNLRDAVRRRQAGEPPDGRMSPEAVAELVANGVRVREDRERGFTGQGVQPHS